ncbi:MAG: translational GTPase TypA [Candidatus Moranbacteria bacterium]|nr:translational GTPase TypA [Candidatus Moranbacteria bacterium]
METRNLAIIAHVDHGKTTITEALMRQTDMISDEASMDSDKLEQERGITIYSKNTSVFYKDIKINIVDTPGHADFGSEVERVLRSIDSVVLVVDAQEGPMPQTRFVLKKALEIGLKPLVVINKIDKPAARLGEVEEEIFELFLDLGANDEQLDFKVIYTIAKQGIAKTEPNQDSKDLTPLLEAILKYIPKARPETQKPLKFQPFSLAYDDYLGRLAIGRVWAGILKPGGVFVKKPDNQTRKSKIIKIFTFEGLNRKEIQEAEAGDIVMIAGIEDIFIGETVTDQANVEPMEAIKIDEPTISVNFLVNDSPFCGREGEFVTNKQLLERLQKEIEINVGLKIDFSQKNHYKVFGRGELHLAVMLENMRREGYEIQVSKPEVIIKEKNGQKVEPFEEIIIDLPLEMSGTIIEKMGKRKAKMVEMKQKENWARIIFEAPTRAILGYRSQFIIDTKGEGTLTSRMIGFKPYVGEIKTRGAGSMISGQTGKALGYALDNLQQRGRLYVKPNTEVYEGMVIGNTAKGEDMTVNPIKGKNLTNVRASGSDDAINLTPPMEITIEKGLEIINNDEYLEITPQNVRIRKKHLSETERMRNRRKN